ncbi:MAG: UDP-N-acetylglucosamine 1-carboxyvinyltransferase [Actinobacteria bacterium]|nr:UDP-N-acetylglucosamine 1-carboxyvinyltransferase [Actinomycetota bacterium]
MNLYNVSGPSELAGGVTVGGAKNAALKMMVASVMVPGEVILDRVPAITDVHLMAEVLQRLGAHVTFEGNRLTIDSSGDLIDETPYDLVTKMRASIQVLGPLLARLGRARVALPGGDAIGSRPIDMHLKGFERMGAKFITKHGYIEGVAERLTAANILLEFPSVGATENILMAAVTAEGTTTIENAAREPEIQDLARFLNESGGRIHGAGTPTVVIEGVGELHPVKHEIIPDRIEAGTFAIGAVATGGAVTIGGVRPDHLELPLRKLEEAGAEVTRRTDSIDVRMAGRPRPIDLVTLPFPGFPTDLQHPMMVLLAQASGPSILTENVFESRFVFVDELARMGSSIKVEGRHAVIRGVDRLSGAPVRAPDIRAGAALVVAGLCAEGATTVYDAGHIKRGYEDFHGKLQGLGAPVAYSENIEP